MESMEHWSVHATLSNTDERNQEAHPVCGHKWWPRLVTAAETHGAAKRLADTLSTEQRVGQARFGTEALAPMLACRYAVECTGRRCTQVPKHRHCPQRHSHLPGTTGCRCCGIVLGCTQRIQVRRRCNAPALALSAAAAAHECNACARTVPCAFSSGRTAHHFRKHDGACGVAPRRRLHSRQLAAPAKARRARALQPLWRGVQGPRHAVVGFHAGVRVRGGLDGARHAGRARNVHSLAGLAGEEGARVDGAPRNL